MVKKFSLIMFILADLFFIGMLITLMIGSLIHFNNLSNLQIANDVVLSSRLFSIAVLITIVTVIVQWIGGRLTSMGRTLDELKGGKNGKRRKIFKD